jgi:hypothetical protein
MEVSMQISLKVSDLNTLRCCVMIYPEFDANLNNWSIKPIGDINELSEDISYELIYKVNNKDMCKHITYKCKLPFPFPSAFVMIKEIDVCLKNEGGVFQVHHVMENYHGPRYGTRITSNYYNKLAGMITSVKNNDIESYNRYKQLTQFSMCLNDIIMMKRNMKELNYTDKCDECCVCYKETFRKTTKCHHTLCVDCFKQLKKIDGELNCPYCRAVLC